MTETPTCDVLLITSRRLADDDHGASVRTARIAEVLQARYRVVVVEPKAPAVARPDVIGFTAAPLDLRHVLGAASADGASVWRAIEPHLHPMTATHAPVVFWADAIVASAGIGRVLPEAAQVVEFANIESRRYLAMTLDGSWKRRVFAVIEGAKAVLWQRRVAQRADAVVALAQGDAQALRTRRPKLLVRNGVQAPMTAPAPSAGTTVLAVGSWWYGPNRHGMRRFLARDWPRVRAAVPDARLLVVGSGGDELGPLPDGVELLGFVDDLDDLYDGAALVLAPARSGGGSQLKLVGALAHGRVVVGPAFLARERTPSLPARAFQTDDDMAASVVRLLRDADDRHEVEREIAAWAARSTWVRTAEPLTRFIDRSLAAARRGASHPSGG